MDSALRHSTDCPAHLQFSRGSRRRTRAGGLERRAQLSIFIVIIGGPSLDQIILLLIEAVLDTLQDVAQEALEGREDGRAALLDAGALDRHRTAHPLHGLARPVDLARQVVREHYRGLGGDVALLREFAVPELDLVLLQHVIRVEHHDHPVRVLLQRRPPPLVTLAAAHVPELNRQFLAWAARGPGRLLEALDHPAAEGGPVGPFEDSLLAGQKVDDGSFARALGSHDQYFDGLGLVHLNRSGHQYFVQTIWVESSSSFYYSFRTSSRRAFFLSSSSRMALRSSATPSSKALYSSSSLTSALRASGVDSARLACIAIPRCFSSQRLKMLPECWTQSSEAHPLMASSSSLPPLSFKLLSLSSRASRPRLTDTARKRTSLVRSVSPQLFSLSLESWHEQRSSAVADSIVDQVSLLPLRSTARRVGPSLTYCRSQKAHYSQISWAEFKNPLMGQWLMLSFWRWASYRRMVFALASVNSHCLALSCLRLSGRSLTSLFIIKPVLSASRVWRGVRSLTVSQAILLSDTDKTRSSQAGISRVWRLQRLSIRVSMPGSFSSSTVSQPVWSEMRLRDRFKLLSFVQACSFNSKSGISLLLSSQPRSDSFSRAPLASCCFRSDMSFCPSLQFSTANYFRRAKLFYKGVTVKTTDWLVFLRRLERTTADLLRRQLSFEQC